MSRLSCKEAQDLATELALGTISGDDRARILTHLSTCTTCRRLVEEMAGAADALLLLSPEHEPPAGFESQVLARMLAPARRNRSRLLAVAAAITVACVGGAGAALWSTSEDRELGAHYRHALQEANGDYFGVKAVTEPAGTKVGNMFVYTGHTDWAFVVFDEGLERGAYEVEILMKDTTIVPLHGFDLTGAERTWGRDIKVDLADAVLLRFHSPSGEVLVAELRS